jgi:hypothetical protein
MSLLVLIGCSGAKQAEQDTFPSMPFIDEASGNVDDGSVDSSAAGGGVETVVFHTAKGEVSVVVEVADTPEAREKGLMHREGLESGHGMLFVFDVVEPVAFHMLNVPFLVDIVFIGEDFEVKNVATMTPCRSNPCPVWQSRDPVKYAVELPATFIKEHRIARGTKVSLA